MVPARLIMSLQLPLAVVSSLVQTAQAQLPYNPTQLLQNDSLVYIFRPSASSSSQFELGALDIASRLSPSTVSFPTLNPSLPFLDPTERRSFTPVIDGEGNIIVYTGDCSQGPGGAQVWTFLPDKADPHGNGSWEQEEVSFSADKGFPMTVGPNFLNAGISFSSLVQSGVLNTELYFFGGMCPSDDTREDWQASANYSNNMVILDPTKTAGKTINYKLSTSPSRGPPIAEAGFALTGLEPTYSNKSDGSQTQQQNFILIGGHTRSAFINMSQIALFALPQQSWTFLPVNQPNPQRTDLAVRPDVDEIEPRSGHTALLTPDGQRVVVFGGWVGDTHTPANPQLAVLNLGEGYGGKGNWEWTAPSISGTGLSEHTGIFGHGAIMLPGGVMMVMGGYTIPTPSSRRRQSGPVANTHTLFFNVSSNSWIIEYNPPPRKSSSESINGGGPLTKASQKAGLGAGLGLGAAAVIGLLAFFLWYTRRLKRRREIREKQLRDLALDAQRFTTEDLSPGFDGRGGQMAAAGYFDGIPEGYYYSTRQQQSQGWRRAQGHEAERTGLLVEIPSPTRGLRRSLGGRPNHHMSRYDEKRVRGSGNIHPIHELEEEDDEHGGTSQPLPSKLEMAERKERTSLFENAPALALPNGPASTHSRSGSAGDILGGSSHTVAGGADSANGWHLINGSSSDRPPSPNSEGRLSPGAKSERTRSDLSDRSAHSNISSNSTSGSMARSLSIRSAALLNLVNPFRTPQDSPVTEHPPSLQGAGGNTPAEPRTRSFTSIRSTRPNTSNGDADSFTTAKSSFMQLQAEGEALLGGHPDRYARPSTACRPPSRGNPFSPTEPAAPKTPEPLTHESARPHRKSWLGSVRRALRRSSSVLTPENNPMAQSPGFEPYRDTSPRRPGSRFHPSSPSPPRRTVSDASLWRSKRGKKDWLEDELDAADPKRAMKRRNSGDSWGLPYRDDIDDRSRGRGNGLSGESSEDEDWDVEAAVERRVVQVMFTVPKTRLRVVNADVDRSSLLSMERVEKTPNAKEKEKGKEGEQGNGKGKAKAEIDTGCEQILQSIEEPSAPPSLVSGPTATEASSSVPSTPKPPLQAPGSPNKVRALVDLFQTQDQGGEHGSSGSGGSSIRSSPSPVPSHRSGKSGRSVRSGNPGGSGKLGGRLVGEYRVNDM